MRVTDYALEITEEVGRSVSALSPENCECFVEMIRAARRVFPAGAGRSGFVVRTFAMRLMHLGFDVFVVGETTTPAITKNDLLIIGSGSGETAGLQTMIRKAKSIGADTALVTIHPNSSIGKHADLIIQIPATTPKSPRKCKTSSIPPKGSLFEQSMFVFFEAAVLRLVEALGMEIEAVFQRHANLE